MTVWARRMLHEHAASSKNRLVTPSTLDHTEQRVLEHAATNDHASEGDTVYECIASSKDKLAIRGTLLPHRKQKQGDTNQLVNKCS
eukprot:1146752-Pelagomonas_calceolata.AAC.4